MGSGDEPVRTWPLMFYPTCVVKGPCNYLNSTNVLNVLNLARFKKNPSYSVALNYTNYTGWSRTINVLHTDHALLLLFKIYVHFHSEGGGKERFKQITTFLHILL